MKIRTSTRAGATPIPEPPNIGSIRFIGIYFH
jgi:hypothetical protein